MKRKSLLLNLALRIAILVVGTLAMALGSWSCSPQEHPVKVESITLAIPRLESSAPYWIADAQHFFIQNGLDVTFYEGDKGLAALDELLKGKADIAGTAESPMVGKVFRKEGISIIGYPAKADYIFLIGWKDRVETIPGLKGKRIGTLPGTILDFYLGRFLELNGISIDDVTFVGVKTSAEAVNAIMKGSIDAVVIPEPFASEVKDGLEAVNPEAVNIIR